MANETSKPQLEISVNAARELVDIGLAVLLDIRQPFELELEGAVEGAVPVPLFRLKQLLGRELSEEEQELLDADEPDERDFQHFISLINRHHVTQDQILLCLCNSGRRSLRAAELLRDLGYARCLSVREGFRGWTSKGDT
ncbi:MULTISPECIES: rhodanese-like domain-containing protein [Thioalkalivibrio]|uniref:Sulfurtransferase n=2 Tax=Thioalkalivibrio TaxID=106633 RepID=A0A0G3G6S0_9GAMM|nr:MULTISPECIES: rhodanese-like domain-containing protein [Thioalkalivibrio]AKJ94566.1 sulfurtransferase [Thioalkalivibrio versutus]OOC48208.1 sulfurtransferase [Thioalkalivibrio versutus]